jgi:mannose-6-phosphate isomerase-like protein (cupin superfamily)
MTEAKIVRALQARVFMDGPELCRDYFRTETMWFGSSTLSPGQIGGLDRGHPDSWEVFYCAAGHAVISDGEKCYELFAGDALVIPPALPHTIHNVGSDNVTIVWAGAPGELVPGGGIHAKPGQ